LLDHVHIPVIPKFKLLKKDATISAEGYIKNVTPSFYMRHFHSRYFWRLSLADFRFSVPAFLVC